MRTFSTMANYTAQGDMPKPTRKLHRRSQQQRPVVSAPRRGTRMMRSMRYWFGTCWGRGRSEDGESVGERESLLDHGKTACDETWDSDEETEFEEEDEDERLMGVNQDGNGKMLKSQGKRWTGIFAGTRKCSRWS